ncbi:MAG TPA: glycoside hydrolase family 15 protein [Candidatus Polarisedimenticolaceae bacterium]|nr:glycoside hydrolase family 15 protein [Candidatus Polarisedimenticolaceae bacterium]
MSYQPIENYGVIGDLHSIALVGLDGSIDFMCFPEFDSPTIFASLLDDDRGGRFSLSPMLDDVRHKQLYLPDSCILLTRFLSADGVAELSDFMPVEQRHHAHDLVRRMKTVRGELRYRMLCQPRFDYARASHGVERKDGEVIFASRGPDRTVIRLRSSVPVEIVDGAAVAEFTLRAGETASFVLEQVIAGDESPSTAADYVSRGFRETIDFWHRWVRGMRYDGRWREMLKRSAMTLKLLTSARHGSIVAAPTFGLPEQLSGERNWDYRYTWIRDASFTLYALIRLGYTAEAGAFMSWIEARCGELGPDGSLQIMYGIDGRHDLTEHELGHLEGYRGSKPVRIGNGAYAQLQLDIYGELMDSVYLYNKYGEPISFDLWRNLVRLIDWVCDNWRRPDEGIWEVRGGRREFLYSKVLSWVAIDRGVRLAMKRSFPAPLARWLEVRDRIYLDVMRNYWDSQLGAFVQYRGSAALDASSLLMPLVKFISPTDPRWLSTLRAIETRLVDDSLVYRYRGPNAADDGLAGHEGTFNMCSFWYVECLSRAGDLDAARLCMEKMFGYANHVGLYGEELGPAGETRGNYPQAFTHLGLISAAYNLNEKLDLRRRGVPSPRRD